MLKLSKHETLELPGTWEEYLALLSPQSRSELQDALAFFEGDLGLRPVQRRTREEIESTLSTISRTWRAVPANLDAVSDALRAGSPAESISFHVLQWGERPLAIQAGLRSGSRFTLLYAASDPEFEHLNPELALWGSLLREWITQGLRECDLSSDPGAAGDSEQHDADTAALAPKLAPPVNSERGVRKLLAVAYSSTPLRPIARSLARRFTFSRSADRLRRNKPSVQIFIYHHINDDADPFFPAVPVAVFRSQMEYIARNFRVTSLDDIADGQFGSRNEHSVAVTFDDGYRDNFEHAFPILKEFGIRATIFLATNPLESRELPWYDQLKLAFKLTVREQIHIEGLDTPNLVLMNPAGRLDAFTRTLSWLRGMEQQDRVSAMAEVLRTMGVPAALKLPKEFLSWSEIRDMQRQGIDFGGHTVSHPVLAKASQLEDEIFGCKRIIEKRLEKPIRHFAYPFGRSYHFSDAAKAIVRAAGFETAVTTNWGFNYPGDDLFELKRFVPWEHDPAMFSLKMDYYRLFGPPMETPPIDPSDGTREARC